MSEHIHEAVAVDFDGVIHAYSEGWKDGTIYDEVIPSSLSSIAHLMHIGHPVFILSTRKPGQIVEWWRENGTGVFAMEEIPEGTRFWNRTDVVGVTNRKLPARWYVDDRAVEFRSWLQVLNRVRGVVNLDTVGNSHVLKEN